MLTEYTYRRSGHSCVRSVSAASSSHQLIKPISSFNTNNDIEGRRPEQLLTRQIKACDTPPDLQGLMLSAATPLNTTHVSTALAQLACMVRHDKHEQASTQAMRIRQRQLMASELAMQVTSEPLLKQLHPKQV